MDLVELIYNHRKAYFEEFLPDVKVVVDVIFARVNYVGGGVGHQLLDQLVEPLLPFFEGVVHADIEQGLHHLLVEDSDLL